MALLSGVSMGFPTDSHIRAFVRGKVVADIVTNNLGDIVLQFTDGECLRLQHWAKQPARPEVEVIVTPFRADGVVKQSTEIIS
jgi:hypothetical protein